MAIKTVLLFTTLCISTCLSITVSKRQGNDNDAARLPAPPSRDLLPPPALSASFPTLRPNPGNSIQSSPHINLIPPFRSPSSSGNPGNKVPAQAPPPSPSHSHSSPSSTKTESLLLPPIEIPPSKPLTDAEIAEITFGVESSFVPTTGQGVGAADSRKNVKITNDQDEVLVSVDSPVQIIEPVKIVKRENTTLPIQKVASQVKFPGSPPGPNQLCPICECTPEVDYICGTNGVIYLNSCSFDCATFCEAGLQKVSLEFCSLPNHL